MASIPKRVNDRFVRAVPKFQQVLQTAKDRDLNEADTVSILQDMLAEVFGYDKYLEVTSEFAIRGTYCDLALKVDDKVQFLVEAKAVGVSLKDGHVRQAVDYGANHGVPWVVLTNGIHWRLYRIRFEQPIACSLVCALDMSTLNPRDEKVQECLFLIAREGLERNAREEYHEKLQSVNRYVIGQFILSEPVITLVRRELRRFSEGARIEAEDIEQILQTEVLKRDLLEGEEADAARARVGRFYKRAAGRRKAAPSEAAQAPGDESATPAPDTAPKEAHVEGEPPPSQADEGSGPDAAPSTS